MYFATNLPGRFVFLFAYAERIGVLRRRFPQCARPFPRRRAAVFLRQDWADFKLNCIFTEWGIFVYNISRKCGLSALNNKNATILT
ncbi:MAG: hypothetical protein DBY30_02140 [Verrucomicrobia bacterium]|nr:MAG: hypothetical protein DBY30_02140 [Verrucomicrobiota bacterium]